MNLRSMCNDKITLINQDGRRHEDVPCVFSSKSIVIPDSSIPVTPGDTILRALPSGIVERYVVVDPGFHQKFHSISAHYQVKYRREGQGQAGAPGYVIHVTGANSRVNIGSTDNSTNNAGLLGDDLAALAGDLLKLREAAMRQACTPEQMAAVGAIATAEAAAKDGDGGRVKAALSLLGSGASWLLDTAKGVGVPVAIAAIKAHLGLPPK